MCMRGEGRWQGGCKRMGDSIPLGAERRKTRMLNCDNDTQPCYTSTHSYTNTHCIHPWKRFEYRAGQGDHK